MEHRYEVPLLEEILVALCTQINTSNALSFVAITALRPLFQGTGKVLRIKRWQA